MGLGKLDIHMLRKEITTLGLSLDWAFLTGFFTDLKRVDINSKAARRCLHKQSKSIG